MKSVRSHAVEVTDLLIRLKRQPVAARLAVCVIAALAALSLAACTDSTAPPVSPGTTATVTQTRPPSPGATAPISTGPTTTKEVGSCPLLSTAEVVANVGQRLAKVTVQFSGAKIVGCTWYPLAHPNSQCDEACFLGEHLPPGTQADVKISSSTYASAIAAHNAFIRLAERGTNYQQEQIATNNTGLCFQTNFWAHDAGKDWACTFAVGTRVVLVNSVVTDPALDVVHVAQAVVSRF